MAQELSPLVAHIEHPEMYEQEWWDGAATLRRSARDGHIENERSFGCPWTWGGTPETFVARERFTEAHVAANAYRRIAAAIHMTWIEVASIAQPTAGAL